ncbi:MAG: hypothetical protein RIR69_583, partial [Actinomycetota bacterium]
MTPWRYEMFSVFVDTGDQKPHTIVLQLVHLPA